MYNDVCQITCSMNLKEPLWHCTLRAQKSSAMDIKVLCLLIFFKCWHHLMAFITHYTNRNANGIQMVGLCAMYSINHLNTGPVHKKTRWHPFVQYSNGRAVWSSNGI